MAPKQSKLQPAPVSVLSPAAQAEAMALGFRSRAKSIGEQAGKQKRRFLEVAERDPVETIAWNGDEMAVAFGADRAWKQASQVFESAIAEVGGDLSAGFRAVKDLADTEIIRMLNLRPWEARSSSACSNAMEVGLVGGQARAWAEIKEWADQKETS